MNRQSLTKTILISSLIFCCLLAGIVASNFLIPAGSNLEDSSTTVRVLTFNIRYGNAKDGANAWDLRRQLVFDLLKREKADLVGLQEALRFQIDQIREALPGYSEVGVGRDDGKTNGEYSAILVRDSRFEVLEQDTFWYSDTPAVPGSTDWGNTIPRVCSWARLKERATGITFYLYNTHFDHRSQPSREKSSMLLAQRIGSRSAKDPVIATGDFNAGEDNPAILYLKGKTRLPTNSGELLSTPVTLEDSFRLLHPEEKQVGTFNGFRGELDGNKIDFVLVSEGVTVVSAEIIRSNEEGRYPSDHYPVSALVKLERP